MKTLGIALSLSLALSLGLGGLSASAQPAKPAKSAKTASKSKAAKPSAKPSAKSKTKTESASQKKSQDLQSAEAKSAVTEAAPPPLAAKAQPAPVVGEKLEFTTARSWAAGRWYVLGQWISADRIAWIGSKGSTRVRSPENCFSAKGQDTKIFRNKEVDASLKQAEILRSGVWVAIEVSPSVQAEEFNLETGREDCAAKFSVSYQWTKGGGQLQPLLFLQPSGNRFYGYEIDIKQPDQETAQEADIQMDLMMGVWSAKFPNATEGANQTLTMIPTAVARGEWLPFKKYWGMQLALEQTVANFGGVTGQNALYSDWAVGTFGEYFLPALDAIQIRGSVKMHQHLGDDSSSVPTIASPNKRAQNLVLGFTSNFYFAKRWMIGVDVDYAPNLSLAGRGVKQGLLGTTGRVGFRVNNFMFLMLEGGYRSYNAVGYSAETVTQAQAGIRLEL